MSEKILTFLHSGDAGDIIAGLAAVKELCEKENAKALLLLDTTGGFTCNDIELNRIVLAQSRNTGLRFNDKMYDFIFPLISSQPYITKVEKWNSNLQINVDFNLNEFRRKFIDKNIGNLTNQNLVFLHQLAIGLEIGYKGQWLFPTNENEYHDIIISRSSRMQSAHVFFVAHEKQFKDKAELIGTDFEYELFENAMQYKVKRLDIENNALNALNAIANSEIFIANSTLFYWLGVGCGHKNIIHELPLDVWTSYFPNQNPNTIHYLQGMHFIK